MAEKKNGGNREEVPLERIVLSNMYSIEALIEIGLNISTKPFHIN